MPDPIPTPPQRNEVLKDILPQSPPSSAPQGSQGSATLSLAEILAKPIPKDVDEEPRRRKITKTIFGLAVLILLGTYGFFTSQLDVNFTWFDDQLGPNVARRFDGSNVELEAKQTELNILNYRMARLLLDEINSQIDTFDTRWELLKRDDLAVVDKETAQKKFDEVKGRVTALLTEAQRILHEPLGIEVYTREPVTPDQLSAHYEQVLQGALAKQRADISSASKRNLSEVRIVDSVFRLAQNKAFRTQLLAKDLKKISDAEVHDLLQKIREEATDEFSSINKIRKQRVDWAQVIRDVHSVVTNADPHFGQGLFKTVGGFLFSSYRFDAKTSRISISGVSKWSDSKIFSLISNLVDSIEKSPKFKDIDFRSFSKSQDEEGDFASSINLDFTLQGESEKDPRDELPLPATGENPKL